MRKTLLLLVLTISISCSTESDEPNNNNPSDGSKLVKREYVSDNHNIEYRYNERDLLSKITDINLEEEINDLITFQYDSNDNLTERQFRSNNSNYESTTKYSYDNSQLTKVETIATGNSIRTITKLFSYSNNIITVNISSNTGDSNILTLEKNSSDLITKMNANRFYSTINYDSKGNILEVKTFENDGNLFDTHTYSYDNSPNPFYGQLKSIYLPLFLQALEDADYGEIVYDGYLGYEFPFLRNNITTINENGSLDRNYSYTYDNDNYPTTVTEIFNGSNAFEFDIEYEN